MPLHLTPEQRRALSTRVMLQAPGADTTPEMRTMTARLVEQRLNGIPGDILFTLDALRLLADQGNQTAGAVLDYEINRLGLTRPTTFGGGK